MLISFLDSSFSFIAQTDTNGRTPTETILSITDTASDEQLHGHGDGSNTGVKFMINTTTVAETDPVVKPRHHYSLYVEYFTL